MSQSLSFRAEALLFDLDGTLVDSKPAVNRVWRAWGDRHDIPWSQIKDVLHGRRAIDTMTMLAPHLPQPEEVERLTEEEIADVEGVVALPDAREILAQLPPDRWAIVTSCPLRLAIARMTAAGIPKPTVLVTAEDVTSGKPAPDGFLLGAKKLNMNPRDCIVFEDAHAGIQAGLAAQMSVVRVGGKDNHKHGFDIPSITDYRQVAVQQKMGMLELILTAN